MAIFLPTPNYCLPFFYSDAFCPDGAKVYIQLRFGLLSIWYYTIDGEYDSEVTIVVQDAQFQPACEEYSIRVVDDNERTIVFGSEPLCNAWMEMLRLSQSWKLANFVNVENLIGRGRFSTVHKAKYVASCEIFALKTIKYTGKLKLWHLAEIRAMTTLPYANLLQAIDILVVPGAVHVMMPLIRGKSLQNYIEKHAPITESKSREILRQLLIAVDSMHRWGVVHRDIKMDNIIMESEEWPPRLRLADFGCAGFRLKNGVFSPIIGPISMSYRLLEQREFQLSGPLSDVWASGIIIYRAITGITLIQKNSATLQPEIVSLDFTGTAWRQFSEDGKRFIQSLLEEDPKNRLTAQEALSHTWMTSRL